MVNRKVGADTVTGILPTVVRNRIKADILAEMENPASGIALQQSATYVRAVVIVGAGIDPTGAADSTAAIQALVDANPGARYQLPAGSYKLTDTIQADSGGVLELDSGAEFVQTANVPAWATHGTASESVVAISSGATEGSDTVVVADATTFVVGDWLMVSCDDIIPATTSVYGMMRQIRTITGTSIRFDNVLHTTLITNPTVRKLNLAPQMVVRGSGRFRHATPSTLFKRLLEFHLVDTPIIEGVHFGPAGGTGVSISDCVGGHSTAHFNDLIDDIGTNHYGYGLDFAGATRGFANIGGSAQRVRHGATTNGTPLNPISVGEPEGNILAGPGFYVGGGVNAGIDSHAHGYGNIVYPNVHGADIGVQVRNRRTLIGPGVINGASLYGIYVQSSAADTVIDGTHILNLQGSGSAAAIRIAASVEINNVTIPTPPGGRQAINATADYVVRGGRIAGPVTGAGVRKFGLFANAGIDLPTTDIVASLIALGLFPSSWAGALIVGTSGIQTTGTVTSRLSRATATQVADIVMRAEGMSGQTGELFQARVNGSARFTVTASGDAQASRSVKVGAYTTGGRPSASTLGAGSMIFDTTLGKPIWSDGTNWKDATGTTV